MDKRVVVIGHPIAAEENRLPFKDCAGLQVTLIHPRTWRSRSAGYVYHQKRSPYTPLPVIGSGRNTTFIWLGSASVLKRLRPDIIYCWGESWCFSTLQVGLIAKRLKIPFLFYRAENRKKFLPWPFTLIQRRVFTLASGCIALSFEISDRLKAEGFRGKIFEIPLWIRPFEPIETSCRNRVLTYFGRMIPLKRVDLLIRALAHLDGFSLRIIGDGPQRENLEALARKLSLARRIEFQGRVDNSILADHLKGTGLVLLPTAESPRQAEQFGKAALEAITCGLPVLTSSSGHFSHLAREFPTLWAEEFSTPKQLAQAVETVFQHYPSPIELEKSRNYAWKKYGPVSVARLFSKAFLEVLSERVPEELPEKEKS